MNERAKITAVHLSRQAIVYLRQSSAAQVEHNRESTERQYALAGKARELGWPEDRILVIDEDLGLSGSGSVARSGFARLTAEVALARVGLVLGLEVSRLARNNADWHRLIDLAGLTDTLIGDADGIYHPALFNDRLLLGLKGTMSEAELHVLRARLNGGIRNKAARGELRRRRTRTEMTLDPTGARRKRIRHLPRDQWQVLLSWVHAELEPHYPSMGRPSIDPVLMTRMLIVGYVFAIRSERALCREVKVNLAYRWFCKLGIEDHIPDHWAFSRARNERFRDSDIFRRVFERVVGACIGAGLVGGKGFAVDAKLIVADANKQRSIPGKDWDKNRAPETASRAVREYLATLDDAAFGAASAVTPKFVSPSDPAAQWTGAMRRPAFFAYADNYLIDVKFGVIVDVEASRAIHQAEVGAAKTINRLLQQNLPASDSCSAAN